MYFRECFDLVLVEAGVKYLSAGMSTSWFLFRLASSVSHSRCPSIDDTLLVL